MSLGMLYAQIAEDRAKQTKSFIPAARSALAKYSITFNDADLFDAIRDIGRTKRIDLAFKITQEQEKVLLDERELINALWSLYLKDVEASFLFWKDRLEESDSPEDNQEKYRLQKEFFSNLEALFSRPRREPIANLDLKKEFTETLIKEFNRYDLNKIKDNGLVSLLQTFIDYCHLVMMINPFYYDRRVGHKCYVSNESPWSTVYSRKTHRDLRIENLELHVERLSEFHDAVFADPQLDLEDFETGSLVFC